MLGSILIALGLVIAIGATLIGIYVINLGCKLNGALGCQQNVVELIGELMKSPEGTMLWAAFATSFVLISLGYSIKSRSR